MSITSTTTLSINVAGAGIADTYTPASYPLVNTTAPGAGPQPLVLAAGDNAVAVPAGAVGYHLQASTTSTNAKVVSSASGTVGVPFTNQPVFLPVAGQASFHVNSVAAETLQIAWV